MAENGLFTAVMLVSRGPRSALSADIRSFNTSLTKGNKMFEGKPEVCSAFISRFLVYFIDKIVTFL